MLEGPERRRNEAERPPKVEPSHVPSRQLHPRTHFLALARQLLPAQGEHVFRAVEADDLDARPRRVGQHTARPATDLQHGAAPLPRPAPAEGHVLAVSVRSHVVVELRHEIAIVVAAGRVISAEGHPPISSTPVASPYSIYPQFFSTFVSIFIGTFIFSDCGIMSTVSALTSSSSSPGHSKISSSCTWSVIRLRSLRRCISASIRFIAILMMSAAVPCTGMLIAARSAAWRTLKFPELISGM